MRYIVALFAALTAIASARADVVKLPVLGGAGGEHFEYQCANDGYLVGLRAFVGLWIDNVQAVCAKYDPVTGRMSQRAPEGPVFGGASGQTNTSDWAENRFPCVRDQLVFGFGVAETKNQPVLGRVYLGCLFSTTLKRPAGEEIQNSIDIMSGDGLKRVDGATCPDGLVAVGIRGRSGIYLDAFGLICGPAGRASSRKEPMTVTLISANGNRATYADPTIRATNGELVLLDWCREWGANCGRPTAELYCKNKGYPFVKSFARTGAGQRTGIITSGVICALDRCVGFREISCGKSDVLEAEPSTGPSPFGDPPKKPDRDIVSNRHGSRVTDVIRQPDAEIVTKIPGTGVTGAVPKHGSACKSGYVWRVISPGDLVCVTPTARALAAQENAEGIDHVDPNGAYGPNTCVSGYVWRNAFAGDVVCVTPSARDRSAGENRRGPSRVVED